MSEQTSTIEVNTADETTDAEQTFAPITPYYAAQVVNLLLQQAGSDKVVTPQMMYSYAKNETIATFKNAKGKVYFEGAAFKQWLDKYLSGEEGGPRVSIEKLADQYK